MPRLSHALLLAAFGASIVSAQPSLDPPAGPIGESGRFGTLIELSQASAPGDADSVFKITQPGSYILTGDINVNAGEIGIELASDDITLDLNGFTVRGNSLSGTVGIGVTPAEEGTSIISNVVIRNGSIRGVREGLLLDDLFFNFGLTNSTAELARVDGITIVDCGFGIEADGAEISNCSIRVTSEGIDNPTGSVSACDVLILGTINAAFGVRVSDGHVTDTRVEIRSGVPDSVEAFIVNSSVVRGCTALTRGNFSTGFAFGEQGATVTDCVAKRLSGSNTIGFNGDGVIANCTAVAYFIGFASNDGVIRGCAAIDCTTDQDVAGGVILRDNNF
ncbi:MAG: hypothetical protein Tsb0013_24520 [Phycisphaerales bacterium]